MRLTRLLLVLITFGPCPNEWALVLRSGETTACRAEQAERPASKCACHKHKSSPIKEPVPVVCSCHDRIYISEAPVHAPDFVLADRLSIVGDPCARIAFEIRNPAQRRMVSLFDAGGAARLRI